MNVILGKIKLIKELVKLQQILIIDIAQLEFNLNLHYLDILVEEEHHFHKYFFFIFFKKKIKSNAPAAIFAARGTAQQVQAEGAFTILVGKPDQSSLNGKILIY
jgi:hypothetical protein